MRGLARRWGTALLAASLVASACGDSEPEGGFTLPRAYEQLDLGTPEAAVAEFGSAFVRRDFITAGLILHPDTQLAISRQAEAQAYETWVMDHGLGAVRARVAAELGGDHTLDGARAFEVAMQEAVRGGLLPVDLTEGFSEVTASHEDAYTALVSVTLIANEAKATVELAPAPSGRWRVRQVRLDNGSPAEFPFSGRPPVPPAPEEVERFDTMRDQLPMGSPTQTVESFAAVVTAGDYVSSYLMLDARGQRLVADLLPAEGTSEHWFTSARLDEWFAERPFVFDLSELGDIVAVSDATTLSSPWAVVFETATAILEATLVQDAEGRWRLSELRQPDSGLPGDLPFPLG